MNNKELQKKLQQYPDNYIIVHREINDDPAWVVYKSKQDEHFDLSPYSKAVDYFFDN